MSVPPAASLPAVSLFSGAGGMDVGFVAAGFTPVFANDIDPDACATYDLNHGCKISRGPLEEHLGGFQRCPEVAAVFGGPPCQGFSVAGKMDPHDARSALLWRFFDVVDRVRPQAFVCENVKALGGLARWAMVRRAMHERAADSGYTAAIIVLNAANYGVPQKRERMFMVGFRNDILGASPWELAESLGGCLIENERAPETVAAITRRLGPAGSPGNPRACNAVVTYAKAPVLRPSPYAGMLFNGAGRPVRTSGYSCTLPASMGGNKTPIIDEGEIFGGLESYVEAYHGYLSRGGKPREGQAPPRLRRMTVDECAVFQSFPESYQFAGKRNAVYRQIGNAVPCRLAEALARVVERVLREREGALAAGGEAARRHDPGLGFPRLAVA